MANIPRQLPRMALNFPDDAVTELRGRLRGEAIVCGTDGYHDARQGFVVNYQSFPQIVVFCESFHDVALAVEFARQWQLITVCRAGGHNTAGYAVNDGIVIDVRRIRHVNVDSEKRRATVGAGATFGELNSELDRHGLHVPGGGCDDVAIAGFMMGGGYGYTSMMFGMNCDCLLEARVLLADGTEVTASADSMPDLFWALRGGTGNNFGVLLEATFTLQVIGELWGFGVRWRLGDDPGGAARVGAAMETIQREFTRNPALDRLGHQGTLNFIDGVAYLVWRAMYRGPRPEAAAILDILLKTEGAENDFPLRPDTYTELNEALNSNPSVPDVVKHTRTQADSRYVDALQSAAHWATLAAVFQTSPNLANFIGFEAYGGAIARVAPTATAFVHRTASFDVYTWVFWLNDAEETASLAFLDRFRAVMAEFGANRAYQNYPNRNNSNYAAMFWEQNLPRLTAVKKTVDPGRFFRYGLSIPL